MGPTWGPSGADRTQVGPMLAPWTLLSWGICQSNYTRMNVGSQVNYFVDGQIHVYFIWFLLILHTIIFYVLILPMLSDKYFSQKLGAWFAECLAIVNECVRDVSHVILLHTFSIALCQSCCVMIRFWGIMYFMKYNVVNVHAINRMCWII